MLLLLTTLLVAQSGGELSYPTRRCEPGTIEILVVDRNRVPLPGALVRGAFETSGPAVNLQRRHGYGGVAPLEPGVTNAEGTALLRAPTGGWCGVTVESPGFAPGSFLPLFSGWAYELALDFGASFDLACVDTAGERIPDVDLLIEFETFPPLPQGLAPLRRLRSSSNGEVNVAFVPRGRVVVHGSTGGGLRGSVQILVGSAWRYNALFGEAKRTTLTLRPTLDRFIPVTQSETGEPIPGLQAEVRRSQPEPGATVTVQSGGVLVRGIPRVPEPSPTQPKGASRSHVTVDVWARGYRALRLRCSETSPPSAETFPFPLLEGISCPEVPADGVLCTDPDPYGSAPWDAIAATKGATPVISVPEEFALVGALVRNGEAIAWLHSEVGGPAGSEYADLTWLAPGAVSARLTVDGSPYRCGLVKLELLNSSVGGRVPLPVRRWTYTDPEGNIEVRGLFPGRWRLSYSTHLISSEGASTVVEVHAGETRTLEMPATRGHTLRGRVCDSRGRPIDGGTIHVLNSGGAGVLEGRFPVRSDGTFEAVGLVPGASYTLRWNGVDPRRFAELVVSDLPTGEVTITVAD